MRRIARVALCAATVAVVAAAFVAAFVAGCGESGGLFHGKNPEDYVKPTIAVMKFENRAPAMFNWNIGDGMREILVDRLMATGRYHVIERQELDSVLSELRFQQTPDSRPQGKVPRGRIKNCQYLIKGTVTDFGLLSMNRGSGTFFNWNLFGSSNKAVMGIILYVVDVESGEIIACENIEEAVGAGDLSASANYDKVAFGGSTFNETPLGRATAKVVDRAIKRITVAIAGRPWEPQIALVAADGGVVLNGGKNHNVKANAEFEVFEIGRPILDPQTGDPIGQSPGRQIGRVIVHDVFDRYATATLVVGRASDLKAGQSCRAASARPYNAAEGK